MALVEAGSPALPVIEEADNRFGVDPAPKGLKKRFVKKTHTLASGDTVEYFAEEVNVASGTLTSSSDKAEDSAHTSGDTGSFVLGVRNDAAAARTSADGDYSPIATDSAGRVGIADLGGTITVDVGTALPAGTNNIGDVDVLTLPALPAGTNNIGDVDVLTMPAATANQTPFASAARSATANSVDFTNDYGVGAIVVIDITATAGDDTFTFKVQGKDEASGKYYDILASAALGAVATTRLRIHPSLAAAANTVEKDMMPRTYRVRAEYTQVGGVADTVTFSVGVSLVP